MAEPRMYFRQLLSGRDFATADPLAVQMVNFTYLIGDRDTGETLVVDPAYGVEDILGVAGADGMRVVGVLATHHHPDHVGGSMMGYHIEGLTSLLERVSVPVHAHREEASLITRVTGLEASAVVGHHGGDRLQVGSIEVELLHTPGHTPGSQCFLVDGLLVAGDTLFLDGCGRTDLPGSDAAAMYDSLQRLAGLPGSTVVYPGHRYSVASAGTLEAVKETNVVFKPPTKEAWLSAFS
ncbi:MAG TPA: MBL fold metallo-hydrolase [Acidimicrobiales bacterium]|nr:MBL fold metallo-hydrolase [Acidimicrobiales bacterium]